MPAKRIGMCTFILSVVRQGCGGLQDEILFYDLAVSSDIPLWYVWLETEPHWKTCVSDLCQKRKTNNT